MLDLFDRQVKAPDRLVALPALFVEQTQPPLALIQMNEDETVRIANYLETSCFQFVRFVTVI
jgi:hypothetical protein